MSWVQFKQNEKQQKKEEVQAKQNLGQRMADVNM